MRGPRRRNKREQFAVLGRNQKGENFYDEHLFGIPLLAERANEVESETSNLAETQSIGMLLDFPWKSLADIERYFIDRLSFTVYTAFNELQNEMFDNSIDTRELTTGGRCKSQSCYYLLAIFKSLGTRRKSHKDGAEIAYETLM